MSASGVMFEQAWDNEEEEAEEEVAQTARSGKRGPKRIRSLPAVYNEAALRLRLEQLSGGVDRDTDDAAWLETLAVTAPDAPDVTDADDDLNHEMAFYNQALGAVRSAQERMTRLGIPYLRPDDYFAEMLKSDQHMGKVKARMIRVQEGIQAAEQRRKQQHNKKFGKQVQREKLQERAQQKRAMGMTAQKLHAQRKEHQGAPDAEFGIGFDSGGDGGGGKGGRGFSAGRGGSGGGGKGGRGGGSSGKGGASKRDLKDAKFGKAHLRKDKRNDAESSGFNRGPKKAGGGKGGGKGKGGGRGGGKGGGTSGGIAKKGKDGRKKKR